MPTINRWTLAAIALVSIALVTIAAAVMWMARRDRAGLVRQFGAEKLAQVQEGAREIEDELNDIGGDLRFAGELVTTADTASDRRRELSALLAVVRQYHLIAVYDAAGTRVLMIDDPTAAPDFPTAAYDEVMAETARHALARHQGELETSRAAPADPSGWLRAFATPLPVKDDGQPRGAIVVLVDTEPFFSKLRLVAPHGSGLLVIGPQGVPTPSTTATLRSAALAAGPHDTSALAELLADMRDARVGTVHVGAAEAQRLGLGASEAIAAYAPISITGGAHWSLATVSPTSSLAAATRAMLLRLGLASAAIAACLIAFGIYVVVVSRRAVALRERLRHADHVAHLHEKTEKIFDHVPAGVLVLSDDGRVTSLNRMLRDRLPEASMGSPLSKAFPAAPTSVVERLAALLEGARASGRVRSVFGERLSLFGEEGQYSLHAVPLEPRFPDARALLVVEDVSEVHSLASQLLRAEKLATVGVLAAGIAHEIGTPLGVVRARAELIVGKLGEGHPQTPGARVIMEQIDRVARTIRQLLDFSRVKPGVVTAVAPAQAARTVVELLRFELDRRKVTLAQDVPEELPLVAADADQLQQVLINLVLNACDACEAGGHIEIRARAAEPSVGADWAGVSIEVTDDGCGVPEALQHQIFDPFFTTKKRGKGTGLGLTIAAQIVRNHGGAIDLKSEVGTGTSVTVRWPTAAVVRVEAHGAVG